jgi:hypothetical protein
MQRRDLIIKIITAFIKAARVQAQGIFDQGFVYAGRP